MKKQYSAYYLWLMIIMLSTILSDLNGQLADGQVKFLGNTHTKGQTPLNFDMYWNQITPGNGGKWASCEQNRDDFNYWLWFDRAYNHAKEFGLAFKEHTLVWGGTSGDPSWMGSVPEDEQMDEVIEWFEAVAERYPDIDLIDVVNEPLHAPPVYAEALGGDGETGWDWVVWCFEKAREYFPNAILILNDYNVLNYTSTCESFLEIIEILQEHDLIDAIGCQGHSLESINFSTIQTNLEMLAATGLDIYISEYEARGDDATQLALYQQHFPYFWEHPSIKGITLWGYLEGDMWRETAYLLEDNGVTERPALEWLRGYFDYNPENVQYQFNTHVNGSGTITLDPAGGVYAPFTDVTITATADPGYVFTGWSGDVGGSTNPTSLSVISNRSVTANFISIDSIQTYSLIVSVSGNGTVTQTPTGTNFAEGTVVTLKADPDDANKFDGWSGSVTSTSSTIEVTMDSDKNLTATFSEIGGEGCDGVDTVLMDFAQNGVGEYCFVARGEVSNVNSWCLEYLEINGEDYTNKWSSSIPGSSDGLIHIYYYSIYDWGHFEMNGTNTTDQSLTMSETYNLKSTGAPSGPDLENFIEVYPNPFNNSASIQIKDVEKVNSVVIYNQLGKIVEGYSKNEIHPIMTIGGELSHGIYYIRLNTSDSSRTIMVNKN